MNDEGFDYDSASRPGCAVEELTELSRNPGLLRALVERNLKVRYKRSTLGFLWSLLNPAAMMVVLTLVFAGHFSAVAPRYPAYVFPGLLLWGFFSQTLTVVAAEVAGGVDLWRRVRLPRTALAIATAFTNLLNLALATVPLVLILLGLRQPLGPALLTLPWTMLAVGSFTLGLALAVATVALRFPDVVDVLGMVLTAWMFATPVFYPLVIVPDRLRPFLHLNPMTLYVELFRDPLYGNTVPRLPALLLAAAVGLAALATGWVLFTRSARKLAGRG